MAIASRPKNIDEALQRGINFIALNDEPGDMDSKTIREYLSVVTLSEAFGYSTGYIAIQIKRARRAAAATNKEA